MKDNTKTRMIKTKVKISDEIGLLWSRQSFGESTISDLESLSNFQVKEEEKLLKTVKKQQKMPKNIFTFLHLLQTDGKNIYRIDAQM